jgi:hypothetical protein
LAICSFAILSLIVPVSLLTVWYATIFDLYEGLAVIALSYLLAIMVLLGMAEKVYNTIAGSGVIWTFREKNKITRNISTAHIAFSALSVPFVPLVGVLKFLRVPTRRIIAGVYFGGAPMMCLTFLFAYKGAAWFDLAQLRYFLLIALLIYVVWKILRHWMKLRV